MVVYFLGAWALLPIGLVWSLLYVVYVLSSNLLFIGTVCPCCQNYGRGSCGSGYGLLASRISERRAVDHFASRFKICLPFLALAWVLPTIGGAWAILRDLGNGTALIWDIAPLSLFLMVAFGVLPFTSKKECRSCSMRDRCPGAKLTGEGRHEAG
jgi:hypothetical protein